MQRLGWKGKARGRKIYTYANYDDKIFLVAIHFSLDLSTPMTRYLRFLLYCFHLALHSSAVAAVDLRGYFA